LKVWGNSNRSAMIRIPDSDSWNSARVEFRMPDASANPYLAIAALAAAVQDGIRRKLKPAPPVAKNMFEEDVDPELYVSSSLEEALGSLNANGAIRSIMGNEVVDTFITLKNDELMGYYNHISPWELDQYLDI